MVLALTCGVWLAASESVGAVDLQRPPAARRFALLASWLDTVDRHVAGETDPPLLGAAAWTGDDLRRLWFDIQVFVGVVERPTANRFVLQLMVADQQGSWRSPEAKLSRADLEDLSVLVRRLGERGLAPALRRAIIVHTDLITLTGDVVRQSAGPAQLGAPVRMRVGDGTSAGAESISAHWEIARLIASRLLQASPDDVFVRDWYRATLAIEQRFEAFDSLHLAQALESLPADPVVLMLAGAQHEAFASPMFQAFRRSALQLRMQPDMQATGAELAAAERLLRAALRHDPAHGEARLRLGHVLGERGRHAEAVRELAAALPRLDEPLLEYCALLFLGASHEALGAIADARAVYERAAAMTPGARVPHLALARLLGDAGEPDEARRRLSLGLAPVRDERLLEPWWAYRGLQGRHGAAWLDDVRRASAAGAP